MRLVAFGCSNTYGHGLADCIMPNMRDPGPNPSRLAWPQLVADKLNLDCVNMGNPGASNKEIWHKAINFKFEPTDTVIFLWSFVDRYCILKKDGGFQPLSVQGTDKTNKVYYKHIHDDYDACMDFYIRCNYIKQHLDSKNIFNLHGSVNQSKILYTPNWNTVELIDESIDKIKNMFKPALDGVHPNEEAHEYFAEKILEII